MPSFDSPHSQSPPKVSLCVPAFRGEAGSGGLVVGLCLGKPLIISLFFSLFYFILGRFCFVFVLYDRRVHFSP